MLEMLPAVEIPMLCSANESGGNTGTQCAEGWGRYAHSANCRTSAYYHMTDESHTPTPIPVQATLLSWRAAQRQVEERMLKKVLWPLVIAERNESTKYPGIRMCSEAVQVPAYSGSLICFSLWLQGSRCFFKTLCQVWLCYVILVEFLFLSLNCLSHEMASVAISTCRDTEPIKSNDATSTVNCWDYGSEERDRGTPGIMRKCSCNRQQVLWSDICNILKAFQGD